MDPSSPPEPDPHDPPLVVWRPTDGLIRLSNRTAAEVTGLTHQELTGRPVSELLQLSPHVEVISEAVALGAIDSCTLRRSRVVTRVLEVGGSREAATVWLPAGWPAEGWADVASWPEAAPMALGYVDPGWCVTSVGADVEALLGHAPGECAGKPLGELLPLDGLVSDGTEGGHVQARLAVGGADPAITVLLAPRLGGEPGGYTFALMGEPEPTPMTSRVSELETRLMAIGAEVRAAGLEWTGTDGGDGRRPGPLDGLTSRQWEIVDALLEGKRVPRIARDLFLSQSTVRNHLAALFKRFGVHSQPELIERLRDHSRRP